MTSKQADRDQADFVRRAARIEAIEDDQAEWQMDTEQASPVVRQMRLADEWQAIRTAQAIEMARFSPVALQRLRDALGSRRRCHAAWRGRRAGAEVDGAEERAALASETTYARHLAWLWRIQVREQEDEA